MHRRLNLNSIPILRNIRGDITGTFRSILREGWWWALYLLSLFANTFTDSLDWKWLIAFIWAVPYKRTHDTKLVNDEGHLVSMEPREVPNENWAFNLIYIPFNVKNIIKSRLITPLTKYQFMQNLPIYHLLFNIKASFLDKDKPIYSIHRDNIECGWIWANSHLMSVKNFDKADLILASSLSSCRRPKTRSPPQSLCTQ